MNVVTINEVEQLDQITKIDEWMEQWNKIKIALRREDCLCHNKNIFQSTFRSAIRDSP